MRIIGISDMHGSIERLELLLELTNADVYVLSGDLLYNPFFNFEDLQEFYGLQQTVRAWRPLGDHDIAMPLFLRKHRAEFDEAKIEIADRYLALCEKAERCMQRKYRSIERICSLLARSKVVCVPGNYDLDLRSTALASMQVHKHVTEIGWLRFAGFGGAPVFTSGIPEHLAARFVESKHQGPGAVSEPFDTLMNLKPDVAVVHVPPFGVLDGAHGRSFGSWGIREFIDQSDVKLLFCGHVHSGWGVRKVGNCVVVNSGNFGQVVEGSGYRHGGYFSEVFINDDGDVDQATLKRLERRKIWHLADYLRDDKGRMREAVIDERRTEARRMHQIEDGEDSTDIEDEKQLQLLEHYNQIKLFLRRFETAASEQRVDDLREMIAQSGQDGTVIAFDVLGSVNMGQSTDASDVDAILYIENDANNNRYNPTYWTDLVTRVTNNRYNLDFTDIIDLWEVRQAIENGDDANEALQRFVIYRTIGRPVNVRLLRKYDDMLLSAGDLKHQIQASLRGDLETMAGTYSQKESFKKYMQRLSDTGVRIPARIQMRIFKYLHTLTD